MAAPIAGLLLDFCNRNYGGTTGYAVLFNLAAGYICFGILCIVKLRKIK